MIWRLRTPPALSDYVWAAIVTVIALPGLAWLVAMLVPQGCAARGDPAVYRWTCMLPGLLMMIPVALAIALPIVLAVNRKSTRTLPDGFVPVMLTSGIVTQVVLIGAYAVALDPAYRSIFLTDILSIPQPFIAGALTAGVFWCALAWRQRQ